LILSWRYQQTMQPNMEKIQVTTKEYDGNEVKMLALYERCDQVTHSIAPFTCIKRHYGHGSKATLATENGYIIRTDLWCATTLSMNF
jgi:hypothetical protein